MEQFLYYICSTDRIWIYTFLFFGAYIENLMPVAPGDTVVVFGAYLVGIGTISFDLALLSTTAGSIAGFMTMFYLGRLFGVKIIDSPQWKFFSSDEFTRIENWFSKYGYGIVAANRFLAGARAVVSLFAGITNLKPVKVFVLALVSCTLWNVLLVYVGSKVGENWEVITKYISHYNIIVISTLVIVFVIILMRWHKAKANN